jgi:hypothetical protein
MDMFLMGLTCGVVAATALVALCLYLHRQSLAVKRFQGALCSKKNDFVKFLANNVNKQIHLDIVLSEKQNDEMRLFSNGMSDFFFSLPSDGSLLNGYTITIKAKSYNDFFHDGHIAQRRLKGHFYLEALSSQQQGWTNAILVATPKYH